MEVWMVGWLRKPKNSRLHGYAPSSKCLHSPLVFHSRGHPPIRSFTLIELLVVMALIALLVGMLLPVLGRVRGEGHKTACAGNLRQIGIAFATYEHSFDGFYPCAQDPRGTSSTGGPIWLWMGRGWRPILAPFFGQKIDPQNPSVLYCKQDKNERKYEATSYAYSISFYHTPDQIDAMNDTKYTWSSPQPSVGQRSSGVGSPDHKILAGEWTSNHEPVPNDTGWWTWDGSRNFLFADGHARYLAARGLLAANDGKPNPCLTRYGIRGRDVGD